MNLFSERGEVVSLTREELRQATQVRVLNEAGQLFQQRGFAATTIRDVAEASGVSVGTVMATGDKNSLLVQVFDAFIGAEHMWRDGAAMRPHSGELVGCAERILGLVQPFLALFTTRPDLARTYASILVSGQHTSILLTDLAARLVDEIQAVIEDEGGEDVEAVSATATAVYFAYVGILFTWAARADAEPSELSDTLRSAFTAICPTKD